MNAQTVLNRISTDNAMWIRQNHYYEALAREATLQGGYEKGVQRGYERGVQKGIEKGMERGEYAMARKTARKMLLKHHSVDEIADLTELSIEEIKKIEEELVINA